MGQGRLEASTLKASAISQSKQIIHEEKLLHMGNT